LTDFGSALRQPYFEIADPAKRLLRPQCASDASLDTAERLKMGEQAERLYCRAAILHR
jgi:hypothetical protein